MGSRAASGRRKYKSRVRYTFSHRRETRHLTPDIESDGVGFLLHALRRARERFGMKQHNKELANRLAGLLLQGDLVHEHRFLNGTKRSYIRNTVYGRMIEFVVCTETGVVVTVLSDTCERLTDE